MSWVEVEGSTVEEAMRLALARLGARREEVEFEVLEEGRRGFLGLLGNRMARVRARLAETPGVAARGFVAGVAARMGVDVAVDVVEEGDGILRVDLRGADVRFLIGRRGVTLNALQFLLNVFLGRKFGGRVRAVVDAEGYRMRREEALRRLAYRLSERVRRTGREFVLEPMSAHERRIIHAALQENPWVYTVSRGEEPYRRVVICLRRES